VAAGDGGIDAVAAPQVLLYQPASCPPSVFVQYGTTSFPPAPGTAADPGWYARLAYLLQRNPEALRGRCVIINGMGSYLFANDRAGIGPTGAFDGEPSTVAGLASSGYVWVDACGLPVTARWYQEPVLGICGYNRVVPDIWADGSGAAQLLRAMGVPASVLMDEPVAAYPQPYAPQGTNLIIAGGAADQLGAPFPYPYAFVTNSNPPVDWPGNVLFPGVWPIPVLRSAPVGYGTYQGHDQWALTLFGVRYGTGMYVYADVVGGAGVTPDDVAAFIWSALQNASPITGPCTVAPAPGPQPGHGTFLRDVAIGAGVVAGLLLLYAGVQFGAEYLLARAGASRTVIEVAPGSGVRAVE
jgi:hypothetical protein